mmetsp:Transcript_27985/g.66295  ORF Transcript_27985/g.66295 Transcript_27985/m.66295 type:complete len:356 (+) Transcript_27985:3-1070(+)
MASRLGDILRHKGVRFIGIGWSAFVVENLVLSEHRDLIINEVGKESYIALYSTLSTAACSSILYGWLRHGRGKGPTLFPGRGGKVVRPLLSFGFHSLGLVGVSQLLPPVTSALGEKAGDPEVSESPVAPLPAVPGAPPSSKCPVPLWMRKGRERPKDSYHTAPAAPADDAAPAPAAAAPSGQSGGICPVTHPIAFVQHWWSGESASVESAAAQQAERLRHEEECAAKLAEEKAELLASEPSVFLCSVQSDLCPWLCLSERRCRRCVAGHSSRGIVVYRSLWHGVGCGDSVCSRGGSLLWPSSHGSYWRLASRHTISQGVWGRSHSRDGGCNLPSPLRRTVVWTPIVAGTGIGNAA